ncbi:MAG: hypothetical protein ACO1NQ_03045 [Flavobacteriales bacterium]
MHAERRLDVRFTRTLTLGRLQMFMRDGVLKALVDRFYPDEPQRWSAVKASKGFAEPFFHALGATSVDSMDFSNYERATILHDLNIPVPTALHGRFDCVVDGGTLEHVFHFPNAIRSCMQMVSLGGHYIGITPANNQMGHGFYQFSPELYFRLFSPENGFRMRTMLLGTDNEWFEVSHPEEMGERGQLKSDVSLTLAVIAQRIGPVATDFVPQQSDYESAWATVDATRSGTTLAHEPQYRFWIRKFLPVKARTFLRNVAGLFRERVAAQGIIGTIDTAHFKRVGL